MIPPLDGNGLLPPGIWDCTLDEIGQRFAFNDHRRRLWAGFLAFLADEYQPRSFRFPVWVDGSFTRSKPYPEDIDLVLDFSEADPAQAWALVLPWRLRHDELKARYHVDLWPRHPVLPQDLAALFQYAGPKMAAEEQIDERHPKGILRVHP